MNKLDQKLKQIKTTKSMGLMTHVVIGYPSLNATIELVKTMATYADIIELQIPFSDPLADGPTIMKACEESLKNGTKVSDAFKVMKELTDYFDDQNVILGSEATPESDSGRVPSSLARIRDDKEKNPALLLMAYFNTVFKYGVEKFVEDAAKSGAAGLIVPDMPIDEEGEEHFYELCKKYNLHAIHVVSPASTDERLQKNAQEASGFVYATARQGTTGIKDSRFMSSHNAEGVRGKQDLRVFLDRVKKYFDIPIAVGFGISSAEQIKALQGKADIAILGSALIDVINSSKDIQKGVEDFLTSVILETSFSEDSRITIKENVKQRDPGQARMTKGKISV